MPNGHGGAPFLGAPILAVLYAVLAMAAGFGILWWRGLP